MFETTVLHIPHASTRIPEDFRAAFLRDPAEELPYMTDWYTDELFDYPGAKLVFPVSRLVCDVERFRDDAQEEMASRGMGVCYTVGHDFTPLRQLNEEERTAILGDLYDPHHRRLTELTEAALARRGVCTVIDCHSFSALPLPYEPDQSRDRPDVCIGTDDFHTPQSLSVALIDAFRRRGYSVAVNKPYAGSIVPLRYYRRDPRVRTVMIELNRGLYLDRDCRKLPSFQNVKRDVAAVLEEIGREGGEL